MLNASGVEVKLSKAQERAYSKLTDRWQSAYELQERLATLDILVDKRLAGRSIGAGSIFFPRNESYFRRKKAIQ